MVFSRKFDKLLFWYTPHATSSFFTKRVGYTEFTDHTDFREKTEKIRPVRVIRVQKPTTSVLEKAMIVIPKGILAFGE